MVEIGSVTAEILLTLSLCGWVVGGGLKSFSYHTQLLSWVEVELGLWQFKFKCLGIIWGVSHKPDFCLYCFITQLFKKATAMVFVWYDKGYPVTCFECKTASEWYFVVELWANQWWVFFKNIEILIFEGWFAITKWILNSPQVQIWDEFYNYNIYLVTTLRLIY